MPGPIDALRFVHAAILHEVTTLEERVHGDLTADAARALVGELATFEALMHGHTHGEEVGLFPRLDALEPHFAQTYLHDHVEERQLFTALAAALSRVADGDGGAVPVARRTVSALRHHAATHIVKENDLILPWVADTMPPPVQGEIVGKVLSVFSAADLERFLPWIVARLDDGTAVSYLTTLGRVQPAEVFARSCAWIKAGIPTAQRERLAVSVEGLR